MKKENNLNRDAPILKFWPIQIIVFMSWPMTNKWVIFKFITILHK